jgi:DNA-binding XRE family transcriptional regulator
MTHAYAEIYLNDGMKNLGEAFDYAVNACKLTLDGFARLFIASGYADKFGKGNPKTIAGLSGTELVMEVVQKVGLTMEFPEAQVDYDCSAEYWCGWILAYYQWKVGSPFRNILKNISMTEIYKLYSTHHEAAEDKFVDTVNAIIKRKDRTTKLQEQRKKCGYSQREVAEMSEVNLRTLQQYELGSKDINKAQAQTVMALANVLGCKIEDLLEPNTTEDQIDAKTD